MATKPGASTSIRTGKRGGGPGRPENLRPPWKKGEAPNPSGRAKRKPITDEIKAQLEQACRAGPAGRTNLQAGVQKLMDQFVGGEPHAQKLVLEYVEGPPTQRIDFRGEVERLADEYGMPFDELYQRTLRVLEGSKAS